MTLTSGDGDLPSARSRAIRKAAPTLRDDMTTITPLALPEVLLITPRRHGDARGWFSETWSRPALAEAGVRLDFVQDNQAFSAARGTVRGLHFQTAPHAQAKLVRVLKGAIYDVAVDIRPGSAT